MTKRDRSLWYSPATLFLLWVASVNALWLAVFGWHLLFGSATYVYPTGLEARLTPLLTVGGVNLALPLVVVLNVVLMVGPLVLLRLPEFRAWSSPLGAGVQRWISANRSRLPVLMILGMAIAVLFAFLAEHMRLPFIQERVMWATDWFPLPTPIDPPLLVRTEYLLSRVFDASYTFVLVNVLCYVVLAVFLVRHFGGHRALVPVILACIGVASHYRFFYMLNGAEAELPAAVLGLVGLLHVGRKQWVGSIFFLTAALLVKSSGVFFVLAALLLLGWWVIRRQVSVRELPWRMMMVCTSLLAAWYAGYVWFIVSAFGALSPFRGPESTFFVHTFSVFLGEFWNIYRAPFLFALAGLAFAPVARNRVVYVALSLFAVRCLVDVGGGYYTVFFVPLAILLTAGLFVRVWNRQGVRRVAPVAVAVAVFTWANVHSYVGLKDKASWITLANVHWDELVGQLEREVPREATVLFRKVSARYHLERAGRSDLTFRQLPEQASEALEQLATPGPVLYMAPYRDFQGAEGPLGELGYREVTSFGGAGDSRFVVLLKST